MSASHYPSHSPLPSRFHSCLSQGVQHLSSLLIIVLGDASTLSIAVSHYFLAHLVLTFPPDFPKLLLCLLRVSQGTGKWVKNPQEKKDHSASEHCSLFYRQTCSSQFLMERYLTIYESCNKMEIRGNFWYSKKAADVITNPQDHGVFKIS